MTWMVNSIIFILILKKRTLMLITILEKGTSVCLKGWTWGWLEQTKTLEGIICWCTPTIHSKRQSNDHCTPSIGPFTCTYIVINWNDICSSCSWHACTWHTELLPLKIIPLILIEIISQLHLVRLSYLMNSITSTTTIKILTSHLKIIHDCTDSVPVSLLCYFFNLLSSFISGFHQLCKLIMLIII